MLKKFAPLAIAGAVGFLLASLLNGGTPASAVTSTSDEVKIVNYSACISAYTKSAKDFDAAMALYENSNCNRWLK